MPTHIRHDEHLRFPHRQKWRCQPRRFTARFNQPVKSIGGRKEFALLPNPIFYDPTGLNGQLSDYSRLPLDRLDQIVAGADYGSLRRLRRRERRL